tara:strand:+ start:171 stop:989 length:819 start_codon:yes stop_codon:yes gene_type:complete
MNKKTKKGKKCHRCKPGTKKIISIDDKWKLPRLFREISPNYAIPDCSPNLKKSYPKDYNLVDKIKLGTKFSNRIIFYFAAHPKKIKNCDIINNASLAYGDLSNQGVGHTNKEGTINIYLKCPQGYREEGNTYISHVHFIISNKKNNKWIPKMKTQRLSCIVSKQEFDNIDKSNCAIILCSSSPKIYIKKMIKNSFSLPYNIIKDLDNKDIINYINQLILYNNRFNLSLKNKKLSLKEVPLIIYCYEKKKLSKKLQEYLINMGFKNVREYILN